MKSAPHPVHVLLLAIILLLGLYLRGIAVHETRVDNPLRADAGDYIYYALNLTEQHTYSRSRSAYDKDPRPPQPDAIRPPGYPAFVGAILWLTPDTMERSAILWFQVVLSVATIALAWQLFHRVLPPAGALAVAALIALSPHLVIMNVYYLTESLYTFALVAAMWTAARIGARPLPGRALATGIRFALATLTRPALQYFSFFLAAFVAWTWRGRRGYVLAILLLCGFFALTIPWAVRNLSAIGATADKTLMINFIAHGMYPHFRYNEQPHTYALPYRFDPKQRDYSRSVSAVLSELYDRAAAQPGRYLRWYLVEKPLWFWRWDSVQGAGDIYIYPVFRSPYNDRALFKLTRSLMKTLHVPLLLLALAGCLLPWFAHARRYYEPGQLFVLRSISLLLGYYVAIHIVGAPFPRYSIPLRPLVYGMAISTICHVALLVKDGRKT